MRTPQAKLNRTIIVSLATAVCGLLVAAVWMFDGRVAVEKLLLRIVAPAGLVWVGVSVALLVSLRRRQWGLLSLLASSWLVLTLGGNG